MSTVSVLTLVRGRERHLANLMKGLVWQSEKPTELVIAWMQEAQHSGLPDIGISVHSVFVDDEPMPLAAARNAAAAKASGDILIFLDVDCIPSPDLVRSCRIALGDLNEAVVMGEVFYLPPGQPDGAFSSEALDREGRRHPSKPAFPRRGVVLEPDHGQLWGLCFAMSRKLWQRLGGMDESFVGYGGEETDFAQQLSKARVPLYRLGGARCWHQHHPVMRPPLDRLEEIVSNANRFRRKWGRWCMDYWLGQFQEMGLIIIADEAIRILRRPTAQEVSAARANSNARFS